MIPLEKWNILTPLQKLPKNVGDLGKIIDATNFEKLPKVQYIAQSELHTQVFKRVAILKLLNGVGAVDAFNREQTLTFLRLSRLESCVNKC